MQTSNNRPYCIRFAISQKKIVLKFKRCFFHVLKLLKGENVYFRNFLIKIGFPKPSYLLLINRGIFV